MNVRLFTIVCLVLSSTFWACQTEQNNSNSNLNQSPSNTTAINDVDVTDASTPKALTISQPFKNTAGTSDQILINKHDKSITKTLPSGTSITIPANAFVDANGNPVTTPVELNFTAYNSPAEIIASGIPMKVVDNDGEMEWMQTAGMFDISGTTNGAPVQIAKGKTVDIAYASDVEGEFDAWFFDEAKGNWINGGATETINADVTSATEREAEIQRLTALTATPPVAPPGLKSDNKLIFNDLDLSKTPELKNKTDLVLSYAGTDEKLAPSNNKWITQPNIWHKKLLEPTDDKGVYQLRLLGNKSYKIPVILALTDAEMAKVKAAHQRNLAAFKANKERLANISKNASEQGELRRLMKVSFMGVHNYDILWKSPTSIPLMADFEIPGITAKDKEMMTVYYITKDEKVVVALNQHDWGKFRFDPNDDNKIIAMLPGKQVALFTQSDFKKEKQNMINAKKSNYVFNMTTVDETVDNTEDLEGLIARARM